MIPLDFNNVVFPCCYVSYALSWNHGNGQTFRGTGLAVPGGLLRFLGSLFFFGRHGRFFLLSLDIFMFLAHGSAPDIELLLTARRL